jgi:hypothetical protein
MVYVQSYEVESVLMPFEFGGVVMKFCKFNRDIILAKKESNKMVPWQYFNVEIYAWLGMKSCNRWKVKY